MWFALLSLASAAEVTVVITPGLDLVAFEPLIQDLRQDGHRVEVVAFPCGAGDAASFVDHLAAELGEGPDRVVVAHGLGATLVAMAAPRLHAEKLVFLGPVLGLLPERGHGRWWFDPDNERPVAASALLGAPAPALSCWSAPFAAQVLSWAHQGQIPVDLAAVAQPVDVAVSLGDDLAAVEAVVPASRKLPDRTLTRLGVTRLDPQDYEHGALLSQPAPRRWVLDRITTRGR